MTQLNCKRMAIIWTCGLLTVVYVITANLGLAFTSVNGFAALIWPPTGLCLAALLLWGIELWPAVFMGALVANYASGAPLLAASMIGVGNTLEALFGVCLLKRLSFHPELNRLRDVALLVIGAACLSTTISATFGVFSLWANNVLTTASLDETWVGWWIGDGMSTILLAPLVMTWYRPTNVFKNRNKNWLALEAVTLGSLLLVVSFAAFDLLPATLAPFSPLPYTLFPCLLWAALRFGQRGATAVSVFVCCTAVYATFLGVGPFTGATLTSRLAELHTFIATAALTGMILAASLAERLNAMDIIEQSRTDLIAAKEAAEVACRTKGAFLANMSHEIRTPLGAVLGFSELMMQHDASEADKQAYADIVTRNGKLLTRIIDDILDLSKVEAGKLEIVRQPVSLNELVSDLVSFMGHLAADKGVKVEAKSEGLIPAQVQSDALRLRQILLNIVGNAVKFTEQGSVRIHIHHLKTTEFKQQIAFDVHDSGPGLSPEQATKLFEPFMQADISTTRKHGGTGLGLTLARRLAQALGGDVTLVKTSIHHGSSFRILIDAGPIDDSEMCTIRLHHPAESPKSRAAAAGAEERLAGMRILLVEDGVDNQELISRILGKAGADVETADNGQDALHKVERANYDAILMDLQMPVMDGYEATERLRQSGYRKPIFALTAHAMQTERERCLISGFDEHFCKPIDRVSLIDALTNISVN